MASFSMKKYIYLILLLLSPFQYCLAESLYPKDIDAFSEQAETCQHFLGEIAGDPAIDGPRDIDAELIKYCGDIDQKRNDLRIKYKNFAFILNKLNSYGVCIGECKIIDEQDDNTYMIPALCDEKQDLHKTAYSPIILGIYAMAVFNPMRDDNQQLELKKINCLTNETTSLGFLKPKYNYIGAKATLFHDNKLIIIYYDYPPRGFGDMYAGGYIYEVIVYSLQDNTWVPDKELTNYFGAGGDAIKYRVDDESIGDDSLREELMFVFPYKTEQDILAGFSDKLFKAHQKLSNKEPVTATIVRKTKLQEVANYFDDVKRYLIKGDQFNVVDISGGWLSIEYNNPKKGIIKGWVICADTTLCNYE